MDGTRFGVSLCGGKKRKTMDASVKVEVMLKASINDF